jgi:hypothetical protein
VLTIHREASVRRASRRLVKPRLHNKQAVHHDAILIPQPRNTTISPHYVAHGINNGANTLFSHSKPNPVTLTTAQPGASHIQRWIRVRNGLGCAGPQFHF